MNMYMYITTPEQAADWAYETFAHIGARVEDAPAWARVAKAAADANPRGGALERAGSASGAAFRHFGISEAAADALIPDILREGHQARAEMLREEQSRRRIERRLEHAELHLGLLPDQSYTDTRGRSVRCWAGGQYHASDRSQVLEYMKGSRTKSNLGPLARGFVREAGL